MLTLSLEMQGDVLLATLSGEVSHQEVMLRGRALLGYAAEKDAGKILINCLGMTGKLSTFERYSLAIAALNLGRSLGINPRIAFVGRPPTFDGFAVRVAINRGGKAALFADVQEALDWLERSG